jgi:hypothetical protein
LYKLASLDPPSPLNPSLSDGHVGEAAATSSNILRLGPNDANPVAVPSADAMPGSGDAHCRALVLTAQCLSKLTYGLSTIKLQPFHPWLPVVQPLLGIFSWLRACTIASSGQFNLYYPVYDWVCREVE